MIKQITKLKDFGIFANFQSTTATVREFKRFNLIYGWNGSGKSTLTKLFSCLEKRKIHDDYLASNFNIEVEAHPSITHINIAANVLNIRVFNQDFITDNIQWDNDKTAKSILILSEEKIEERKKLELLNKELFSKQSVQKNREIELTGQEKTKDTFLSATAKSIKEAYKIIDTSDTHYFNYSKTKLESFINANEGNLKSPDVILSGKELAELTTAIQPNSKPLLTFVLEKLEDEQLTMVETKIVNLVTSNILNRSIQRLKENPDLQEWVRQGLELHVKHTSESCEYCGQVIPLERNTDIQQHFNEQYVNFITKIDNALNWLTNNKLNLSNLPDASNLYDEFQKEYLLKKDLYLEGIAEVNVRFSEWEETLKDKKLNPFLQQQWISVSIVNQISLLNAVISEINEIKDQHNKKTENFDSELKALKSKLESHYAADYIKEGKYFALLSKINTTKDNLSNLAKDITTLKKEILEIEKELTDEVKGASQFNDLLHGFLGRDDISLEFIEAERGYKILRKGSNARARNLSEGEKTAIAFIYFVIKLKESGNLLSNTIVVVDDPVSSLDSNHIIHAYAFLKNECNTVKQLFVLTHNFHFFKLIRDWFDDINIAGGDKNHYTINSKIVAGTRHSSLVNANNFLLRYNSEYQYLFCKLNDYAKNEVIEIEEMFVIANLSRRFIESLTSFKYPKKSKLWEKFKKVNFDETQKTKIYKFINLYSHNDKIESHEAFGDNLFAEGKPLVISTLEFIKAIDEDHYNELMSIYN